MASLYSQTPQSSDEAIDKVQSPSSASSLSHHSKSSRSSSPMQDIILTMSIPPSGGSSQTTRHSPRSYSSSGQPSRQASTISLDRTLSNPGPSSPITSPSIYKSLTALDAKAITRDMEKSALQIKGEEVSSPNANLNPNNFYFGNASSGLSFQSMAAPSNTPSLHHQYLRQNSCGSVNLPSTSLYNTSISTVQGDAWQSLCVRVLPLFNGEGVQGAIEDLNELLRRCLSDSLSAQFYRDIESLLRDGMFTLNAKMFGVTDEKLLDRLVEQWSFFFTYALPYFEAVFLPLRTDIRFKSPEEEEVWNVRSMALRSFRDNVILLQTKRLEDVFNKLFTDFGSSQNPAATAAKMLQMTSLLASSPDHNEEMERVLSNLKANWKIMMNKGDRRGFAGVRRVKGVRSDSSKQIFGTLQQ